MPGKMALCVVWGTKYGIRSCSDTKRLGDQDMNLALVLGPPLSGKDGKGEWPARRFQMTSRAQPMTTSHDFLTLTC